MLAIWISSIFTGLCAQFFQSKGRQLINMLSLVLLILLMSCNNAAYDEVNMQHSYGSGQISMTSWLYGVCAEIAFRLGLNFGWFNFVVISVACCIIAKALSKFTSMWGVCIGLFAFSAALSDTTLFKHFLATAFLVYAMTFMMQREKNKKKFLFFFFLACGFHLSMGVYAILLFTDMKKWNKRSEQLIYLFIGGIITVLFFGTILSGGKVPGAQLVADFVEKFVDRDVASYVVRDAMGLGWLYMLVLWLLSFLSIRAMKYAMEKKIVCLNDNASSAILTSYKLVHLSLVFLPFCMMRVAVFSRLYRPMIWVIVLCFAIILEKLKAGVIIPKVHLNVIAYCLAYFVICNLIIFYWDNSSGKVLEGTLFFINNSLSG